MNILSGLTCVFILMKVCKVIDWNWWIVLAPAIIEVGIFGFLIWLAKKIFDKFMDD